MARRPAPPGTQAVLRSVRLLKTFSVGRPELTLSELCQAVGLTKTTAHRLLAALESEGLVARNPTVNTYRLGPAAIALGSQALRTSDLRALARPALERLAAETGETATLEILMDGEMLTLDEVSSRRLLSAAVDIGSRWPLHATSTGKALLAALPDEQRRALLQPPLGRCTPATVTRLADLAQQLDRVRKQGYATAVEELETGYVAVGAVFRGPSGKPAGTLSVGGPVSRLPRSRLAELGRQVREIADEISNRLGHGSSHQP